MHVFGHCHGIVFTVKTHTDLRATALRSLFARIAHRMYFARFDHAGYGQDSILLREEYALSRMDHILLSCNPPSQGFIAQALTREGNLLVIRSIANVVIDDIQLTQPIEDSVAVLSMELAWPTEKLAEYLRGRSLGCGWSSER